MKKPNYCTRETVEACYLCSLTNYRKDCMNNPVQYPEDTVKELMEESNR